MKFSTIVQILFNYSNVTSKQGFTKELLEHCIKEAAEGSSLDEIELKTFYKYYSGDLNIKQLIKKIGNQIDKERLNNYIYDLIGGNEEIIERLYNDFISIGEEHGKISKENLEEYITNLLINSFFEEKVTQNKVPLNNSLVPIDLEKIYNVELANANSLLDEPNKKLKYANKILEEKLPEELRNDFKVSEKIVNEEIKFSVEPKTEDAYKKHPRNIKITFEKMLDRPFREYINEANRTRQMVEIGRTQKIEEFLGKFPNPLPESRNQVGILYIGPVQNPKRITLDVILKNEALAFELKNQVLLLLEEGKDFFVFSNLWNTTEKYKYEIKVNVANPKSPIFSFVFEPRDKYKNDIDVLYEYSKFHKIIFDKKATMILKSIEGDFYYNLYSLNGPLYNKKQYQDMKRDYQILQELIEVERMYNFKFKVELEKIPYIPHIIKIAHNSLIDKKDYIKMKCQIPIIALDGEYETYQVGDAIEGTMDFTKIKLFEQEITLENAVVELQHGKVCDKAIVDGQKMIKVDITGFKVVKDE